jgi:flagellar motor protein MotB
MCNREASNFSGCAGRKQAKELTVWSLAVRVKIFPLTGKGREKYSRKKGRKGPCDRSIAASIGLLGIGKSLASVSQWRAIPVEFTDPGKGDLVIMTDVKRSMFDLPDDAKSRKAPPISNSGDPDSGIASFPETTDLEWMFRRGTFGETVTEVRSTSCKEPDYGDLIAVPAEEREDLFSGGRTRKNLHWSVPWSDLMMTMFVFFAVLYVFHSSKEKAFSDEPKPRYLPPAIVTQAVSDYRMGKAVEPASSMTKIYDLSRETVRTKALEEFASVALTPDKTVSIILKGDLLFDSGKAELRPEATRSLGEIGEILRQTPYVIDLAGHTDDVPIHSERFPTNWELSAARACAVARYLIDEMGLPSSRFFITGYGAQQPVRPNDSAEDRAANRRVEIIITKEKPHAEPGKLAMIPGAG